MKKALITGCTGQDGSYLAEYLHSLGYEVWGTVRRDSKTCEWFEQIKFVKFVYVDMRDQDSLTIAIRRSWPDEIYNLAGQVFVPVSWQAPDTTFDVNTTGLARIFLALEMLKKGETKVYQASSSEMYGNGEGACNERTSFNPVSPYGVSKYAAHRLVDVYRQKGYFAVAGVLFNHESPRRGREMVTQKIATHVAGWALGHDNTLALGSLEARRDWGHSRDYVRAMHAMLQQDTPTDFVIGTGQTNSVQEFLELCLEVAGLSKGKYLELVDTDKRMLRDNEIRWMCADPARANEILKWEKHFTLRDLASDMVNSAMVGQVRGKQQHAVTTGD